MREPQRQRIAVDQGVEDLCTGEEVVRQVRAVRGELLELGERRGDLDAYMDAVSAQVTGEIGLRLYKGSVRVVTRSSPNAVYDAELATFAESGGLFDQNASPGFIELWSLQSRMAHRVRVRGEGER